MQLWFNRFSSHLARRCTIAGFLQTPANGNPLSFRNSKSQSPNTAPAAASLPDIYIIPGENRMAYGRKLHVQLSQVQLPPVHTLRVVGGRSDRNKQDYFNRAPVSLIASITSLLRKPPPRRALVLTRLMEYSEVGLFIEIRKDFHVTIK